MLSGLHDIEWENLHHAYGPAKDTPWHIRGLTSFDAGVREYSLNELFFTIIHQGTVYEATSRAIPFLILLLVHPQVKVKADILSLLACCAEGTPSFTAADEWYRKICEKEGKNFDEVVELALDAVKKVKSAVRSGLTHYISLLEHSSKHVRLAAVRLLITLCEDKEQVLSALDRIIFSEPDRITQAQMFGLLGDYLPKCGTISFDALQNYAIAFGVQMGYLQVASSFRERIAQFASAVEFTKLYQRIDDVDSFYESYCKSATDILLTAISRPKGLDPVFRNDTLGEDRTIRYAVSALVRLSKGKSANILCDALKATMTAQHAHMVAITLLGAVLLETPLELQYSGSPRLTGSTVYYGYISSDISVEDRTRIYPPIISNVHLNQLSEEQKASIKEVFNNKLVWAIPSNLLESFGLPGNCPELL